MKRILTVLTYIACLFPFAAAVAQSGYGTGGGFNPENPPVPGANGLYLERGEVVLDGLSGDAQEAVGDAIYSMWTRYCYQKGYGEYSEERRESHMLEVFGIISEVIVCADFSSLSGITGGTISISSEIGSYFENMTTLDLSRTTGWTVDYGLGDGDYLANLSVLILPDCVEQVPSMEYLHSLTDVYIYAPLPPVMETSSWYKPSLFATDTEVKVHVPAASLDLYKNDETWGKYNIVPENEEVGKIEVKMPQGVDLQRYRNMWLTLTDQQAQTTTRYAVSDRTGYFFPGVSMTEGSLYTAALVNRFGTVVSQVKDVQPAKGTTTVQLTNPLPVVTATVKNANDDIRITWYDAQGDRITSSTTLAGLVPGDVVSFDVNISGEAAKQFAPMSRQTVTVPADVTDDYAIYLQMKAYSKHAVIGFVRDADTHLPLHEITVTSVQDRGGTMATNTSSLTYSDGRFIVQCLEGPLTISLASKDYVRRDLQFNIVSETPDEYLVGDYYLKRNSGKTISLDIWHTNVGVGQLGPSYSFLDAYEDVKVEVYNESKDGQRMTGVSVQLPQVVILSGADEGDELRLDFSSTSGRFAPFSVPVTVSGTQMTAKADFVFKGGYQTTIRTTQNGSLVSIVYDSEGNYVRHDKFKRAELQVKGLDEGDYTVVTMAYDPVVSRLNNLPALTDMGLRENTDYVARRIHVSPGIYTVIDLDNVPMLDLDELKIIHPSTTFTLSEQQVTRGDYIAVRARVKVKNEIAQDSWSYGNFRLVFDLPKDCPYMSKSLMVNGKLVEPEYEDGRLELASRMVVRCEGIEEGKTIDVRFCITARALGQNTISALVGYTKYDWENGNGDFYSPVGAATFEAIPMKYHILAETPDGLIASGNGPSDAVVSAYEDGTLIGQTTIIGKAWSIEAPLPSAYNLSLHNVYLECKTKEGDVFTTPTTTVMVNSGMNAVNRVTMIYPNAYYNKTEVCTWEFLKVDTKVESYDYYPASTAFTFLTEFLRNDTTEISDVRLRVNFENNTQTVYPATFDESRGCWVTAIEVDEAPPVNVAVFYERKNSDKHVDRQLIDDHMSAVEAHVAKQNQLAAIFGSITDDNIDEKMAEAGAILGVDLSAGTPSADQRERMQQLETMSADELHAELESLNEEADAVLAGLSAFTVNPGEQVDIRGTYTLDDGSVLTVSDCTAYNESTILDQGFEEMVTTAGSSIYIKSKDNRVIMVDFKTGYCMDVKATQDITASRPQHVRAALMAVVNKCIDFLKDAVLAKITDTYNSVFDKVKDAAEFLMENLQHLEALEFNYMSATKNKDLGMIDRAKAWAKLKAVRIAKGMTTKQLGHVRFVSNFLSKLMIVPNYILLYQKYSGLAKDYAKCDDAIPNPCPKAEPAAENIRSMIDIGMGELFAYCVTEVAYNVATDAATLLGVGLSLETFGVSLLVSAASILAKTAIQWAMDWKVESSHMNNLVMIRACIRALECEEEDDDPGSFGDYTLPDEPYTPGKKPLIDPSGFVCEAVESNRLEGVTATCLYKKEVEDMYGDKHMEVTVWDAENYGQVNPLLTDKQGMYSWMVPAGQWQVLYEKDGYETQRSEWLPVPPPQLDVNVAMVRRQQPELLSGKAYERAIDVDFSLYMKLNTITPQTLTFWQDGEQLSGTLTATNGEAAFGTIEDEYGQDRVVKYGSMFRFVPKKTLAVGSKVTVRANAIARSYADVPMGDDIELTLTVGREVTSIGSDGNIIVPYGGTHQVVITAKGSSAAAVAYQTVTVLSLSPDIATLQTDRVTLDSEGKAYITVIGRLPGTTYLTFAVDGSPVEGMDTVRVVSNRSFVKAPEASIISGMFVESGTRVALTAADGCTIWYTLDGSCPCDEAKRQQYTAPITINGNTKLRAMAVDANGNESEVVTFTWFIQTGISEAVNSNSVNGNSYDLQGRKMPQGTQPTNGNVIIVDGRKVLKQ